MHFYFYFIGYTRYRHRIAGIGNRRSTYDSHSSWRREVTICMTKREALKRNIGCGPRLQQTSTDMMQARGQLLSVRILCTP
jgi:hypothetical protein